MKHDEYKKLLSLVISDELSEGEKRLIHAHMEECSVCRIEYEKLEKLKKLPLKESFIKPEKTLLELSRAELLNRINRKKTSVSIIQVIINFLRYLFVIERKTVLVGSLMMVFGIIAGFMIAGQTSDMGYLQMRMDNSAFLVNQPQINNLKFNTSDISSGNVDFTFDEVITFRMNGNMNEPKIQKTLAYALVNEQNPGVKLKTISAFNVNHNSDKVIKAALIQTVKTDNNPGVRSEALLSLSCMPYDEEVRDALVFVLKNDNNSGLRQKALLCIEKFQKSDSKENRELYNTLKTKMETDENSFIKYRARTLLEEVKN